MPSSIPGFDISRGERRRSSPTPPTVDARAGLPDQEARAKPALESGPAHPLAPTLRAVGRLARRKPLGALGGLGGAWFPFPSLVILLAVGPLLGPGLPTRGGPPTTPGAAITPRVTRGATIAVAGAPCGGAAGALGGGPARITPRHILPNV